MKKVIVFILSLVIFVMTLGACGESGGISGGGNVTSQTTFSISMQSMGEGSIKCHQEHIDENEKLQITNIANGSKVGIGESVIFTLTANAGYTLESFTINGGNISMLSSMDGDKTVYSWTMCNIVNDVVAKATFCDKNVVVTFDPKGGICDTFSKNVYLNESYGSLPTPFLADNRFIGWTDESGELVTASSKVTKAKAVTLTANWGEVVESEKVGLDPYAITTTLYNASASEYGVVWHTDNQPIAPVIQVVESAENAEGDFSESTLIGCDIGKYSSHYISTGILGGLKFETEYQVRVGDFVAGTWSDTYSFTTRKEVVEKTNFIYVTDTQAKYDFDNSLAGAENILYDKDGNRLSETFYENVLKDALTRFPETNFITHGGDMFDYGGSEKHVVEMIDSTKETLFQYPTQITSGNHEGTGAHAGAENLSVLYHYDSASTEPIKGDLYSFDYGYVHFFVLRSNDIFNITGGNYSMKLNDAQIAWLESDLASVDRTKTPWVVGMMHESFVKLEKPQYASHSIGEQLLPLTTKYGVDVMLFGHAHQTLSTKPIVWDNSLSTGNFYNNKISVTANTFTQVDYDGVKVDKFNFGSGNASRGTVFHQSACAGDQINGRTDLSWNNRYNVSGYIDADTLAPLEFMRVAYNGRNANFLGENNQLLVAPNKHVESPHYSMYSYIEATADALVLRTYGVDCKGLASRASGDALTDYGVYLEGFMLNK